MPRETIKSFGRKFLRLGSKFLLISGGDFMGK